MGIKGLFSNIKRVAPECISQKNLSLYAGSRVAIDAEILIYKYRHNKVSKNLTSDVEKTYSYLYPLINTATLFLKNNIHPVYVFDGKPIDAKQTHCISARKAQRNVNYQKLDKCQNELNEILLKCVQNENDSDEEKRKIELVEIINSCKNKIISKDYKNEFKMILKMLGLPVLYADDDAERMCVDLVRKGFCDYVYTEDSDAIVYAVAGSIESNGQVVKHHNIKILKSFTKNGSHYLFTEIDVGRMIAEYTIKLKYSEEDFINFCITSGCDFVSSKNDEKDIIEARKIFNDTRSYYEKLQRYELYFEMSLQKLDTNLYDFVVNTAKINAEFIKDYIKSHNKYYSNSIQFRNEDTK